jgi:hypothetical protein
MKFIVRGNDLNVGRYMLCCESKFCLILCWQLVLCSCSTLYIVAHYHLLEV